ncbi:Required for meiotic nuclear division protein 1 isoform 1 [Schistosoma japonicum]|uniref:Required for meiotic nuclear division protein 1 isoform 1 n=2 Tax=Schistosoma japonicum TaxID=6182 RepID=A0A4Z2D6J0_SCHJA|nr:Required for meiotic nuclear division protein 1 isoform 1 [Schistosoma japonicum]
MAQLHQNNSQSSPMSKLDTFMFTCKFPLMRLIINNNLSTILYSGLVHSYSTFSSNTRTSDVTIATTYSSSKYINKKLSSTTGLFQPSTPVLVKPKDHQSNLGLGLFHPKKKRIDKESDDLKQSGFYNISGYGFAQYTDLKLLYAHFSKLDLYKFPTMPSELSSEVLLISQLSSLNTKNNPRDVFVFNNGVAVFWNIPEENHQLLLKEFRQFSEGTFEENLVEREDLRYCLSNNDTRIVGEDIYLQIPSLDDVSRYTEQLQIQHENSPLRDSHSSLESISMTDDSLLQKFAFSDALALSIKLSLLENGFDAAVVEIEPWIEKMKTGHGVRFRQSSVLRKTGELYTIKHLLNVSTSLIETPDFYWERPDIEKSFEKLKCVLSVPSRIKILNSRLDMCNELTSILTNHLCSLHSTRLEWMVIILIFVEVIFEAVNYYDKSRKH